VHTRALVIRMSFAAIALHAGCSALAQEQTSTPALRGTVVNTMPGRSFAIMEIDGQSVLVRIGATIPSHGVLVRVEAKSVVLQQGTRVVEFAVGGGSRPAKPPDEVPGRVAATDTTVEPEVPTAAAETPPERRYLNQNGDQTPYPHIP
jgi:type II secretory pathway component PulC